MNTALMARVISLLILATPALAQEAIVAGTATDETGAVLPGVAITAVHEASGNTFTSVTSERGQYRLAVRAGVYSVAGELSGFAPVRQTGVELLVGQQAVVNLRLALTGVEESITVSGQTALVDLTQSKVGGNVDSRQMQDLPLNGRNWMQLSMLVPGVRANSVADSPVIRETGGGSAMLFQFNVDGQQVTQALTSSHSGEPRFSRDAIAEFEVITNRFDATQGRSMGMQVNVITKSGTNQYSGTLSGYFRDEALNAADPVVRRVLPYSNQQVSGTFGGPIRKDRIHVFGAFEAEREPQAAVFTTPFPAFNIPDIGFTRSEKKGIVQTDSQFTSNVRLMVRGSAWDHDIPINSTPGATSHPSTLAGGGLETQQLFASLTQTIGATVVHEVSGGYTRFHSVTDGIVPHAPLIRLRGFTIGKRTDLFLDLEESGYSVRDQLTYLGGAWGGHELKIGGEYLYRGFRLDWCQLCDGEYFADIAAIPANIESLFPVWNDPSTWNLAALSPSVVRYRKSFGEYLVTNRRDYGAAWIQDNWTPARWLTLNLGIRYDVAIGSLADDVAFPPFRPENELRSDLLNFAPRFGVALKPAGENTVVRGGWGKFFGDYTNSATHGTLMSRQVVTPSFPNDGRPDFAADPFNGQVPTFDSIRASGGILDTAWRIAPIDTRMPYGYQASLGIQHEIAGTTGIQVDYVYATQEREVGLRNLNLAYNPATGANYPFTDPRFIALRPYPEWGAVGAYVADGSAQSHVLTLAVTRRFSGRWQASGTYTLSRTWSEDGLPAVGFPLASDFGGERTLANGDQRHRAVFSGIWELPYGFQTSGVYFFGSGERYSTSYGGDLRNTGGYTSARLRPDGTLVPRNNFVGNPLHRVDLRLQKRFWLAGRARVDGQVEVFNVFNHANYGAYTTQESSPSYGQPSRNARIEYQPRMIQLGVRFAF